MTEFREIQSKIRELKNDARETNRSVDWRLDRDAVVAREELLGIQAKVQDFDFDNTPKFFRLDVGGSTYTSIRRLEGHVLYETIQNKTIFEADPKLFPDRSIGLIFLPWDARIVSEKLREIVESANDDWYIDSDLDNFLATKGLEYNPADWEILHTMILFERVGKKFYKLSHQKDTFDKKPIVVGIKEVNGKIPLWDNVAFKDEEFQIKRRWYDSASKMYVLLKGSSDAERTSNPVKNLVPQKVGA